MSRSFMLRFLFVIVACLLGPATREASAEELRFLSFNVRYATARDGENRWEKRRDLVVEVIRDSKADVVGLQEVLHRQLEYLRKRLPGYEFLGQGRDGGQKGEYSPLLVRRKRLRVEEHGEFWLSPKPAQTASRGWDAALPRLCTWAEIRDRLDERRFVVLNTHFDHRGKDARKESARLIVERLREHAGRPAIVMGDLNTGEGSEPMRILRDSKLRDAFRVLHPEAEGVGTFNGFKGRRDGAKIDYVLCTDEWKVEAAAIVRTQDEGRYPSDHFPVSATLSLVKTRRKLVPAVSKSKGAG